MYRLVALDVDGTLLTSTGVLTSGVRHAVAKVKELGVWVTLATGRRYASTGYLARELGIDVPVVIHNGGAVVEPRDGRVLESTPLERAVAERAVRLLRKLGAFTFVFDDICCSEQAFFEEWPAEESARKYVETEPQNVTQVADLLQCLPGRPLKLLVVDTPSVVCTADSLLRAELGREAKVFLYSGPGRFSSAVEVFGPSCSKAAGVASVARRLGVSRNQVLAIGDDVNDVELLHYAGLGIAMHNSVPEALEAAAFVAPSNDSDGVAIALRKYVLQEAS